MLPGSGLCLSAAHAMHRSSPGSYPAAQTHVPPSAGSLPASKLHTATPERGTARESSHRESSKRPYVCTVSSASYPPFPVCVRPRARAADVRPEGDPERICTVYPRRHTWSHAVNGTRRSSSTVVFESIIGAAALSHKAPSATSPQTAVSVLTDTNSETGSVSVTLTVADCVLTLMRAPGGGEHERDENVCVTSRDGLGISRALAARRQCKPPRKAAGVVHSPCCRSGNVDAPHAQSQVTRLKRGVGLREAVERVGVGRQAWVIVLVGKCWVGALTGHAEEGRTEHRGGGACGVARADPHRQLGRRADVCIATLHDPAHSEVHPTDITAGQRCKCDVAEDELCCPPVPE
eukprot:7379613-Prymnesium_polylepis.1